MASNKKNESIQTHHSIDAKFINNCYKRYKQTGNIDDKSIINHIMNWRKGNHFYLNKLENVLKHIDLRDISLEALEELDFKGIPLIGQVVTQKQLPIILEKSRGFYHLPTIYLEGLNFSGLDFSGLKLDELSFRDCNFEKANFSKCVSMNGTIFEGNSNFRGANFSKKTLSNVSFGTSEYCVTDLSNAKFTDCKLVNVNFGLFHKSKTILTNANFTNSKLHTVQFGGNVIMPDKKHLKGCHMGGYTKLPNSKIITQSYLRLANRHNPVDEYLLFALH